MDPLLEECSSAVSHFTSLVTPLEILPALHSSRIKKFGIRLYARFPQPIPRKSIHSNAPAQTILLNKAAITHSFRTASLRGTYSTSFLQTHFPLIIVHTKTEPVLSAATMLQNRHWVDLYLESGEESMEVLLKLCNSRPQNLF